MEIREKAGASCGVIPANGHVVLKITRKQKDMLEGKVPDEGIYGGKDYLKEQLKTLTFDVVAVPTEFVVHEDKAPCRVGDKVFLVGEIKAIPIKEFLVLVPSRSIGAVVL
jgi:hypothetical protein